MILSSVLNHLVLEHQTEKGGSNEHKERQPDDRSLGGDLGIADVDDVGMLV